MKQEKTEAETELEEQKLAEILLLLDQLFRKEELIAKTIVGCLYDIATINIINKYFPYWGINSTLKYLTRFPRPLAKSLGVKLYLQTQCPKLITDWLYTLVEFPQAKPIEIPAKIMEEDKQIKVLRNQIKLLTGALVTSIAIFSGSFFWIAYKLELNPVQLFVLSHKNLSLKNSN